MKRIFANDDTETFTVAELKKFLDSFPDDMPIVAIWEGQISGFRPEMFEQEEAPGHYAEKLLTVDVETYS